jgi:hypothetical protein
MTEDDDIGKYLTADFIGLFVANREMEDTRSYLDRGRAFADLTNEALNAAWVKACRAVHGRSSSSREAEFRDLKAELRLRGLKYPLHLVKPETERTVKRLREATPADNATTRRMEEEIRRFKEQLAAAPRH